LRATVSQGRRNAKHLLEECRAAIRLEPAATRGRIPVNVAEVRAPRIPAAGRAKARFPQRTPRFGYPAGLRRLMAAERWFSLHRTASHNRRPRRLFQVTSGAQKKLAHRRR